MKTIWKYAVGERPTFTVALPVGAQILSMQVQRGTPQMWALVDPQARTETRTFRIIGTGWDVEDDEMTYIGTFQQSDGAFVFHLFELTGV